MSQDIYYIPVLRTRAAELKAYEKLWSGTSRNLLPLFELTRARRTKNDGEGDISKNVKKIKEMVGDNHFALDLTTTDQLSNKTISEILSDTSNGFHKWVDLVKEFQGLNVIPAIHINYDALHELPVEVNNLKKISKKQLLRIPIEYEPYDILVDFENAVQGPFNDIIVIIDGGFININDQLRRDKDLVILQKIMKDFGQKFHSISYTSSSFPSSVVLPGYGGDSHGYFKLPEPSFFDGINVLNGKTTTCYSDYATVHPLFYSGGGGWVPRVDYPMGEDLYYYRYRREDGGYIKAAQHVANDRRFNKNNSDWGSEEVIDASQGDPNGKSPSHWISVRMSMHMCRQVERLKAHKCKCFAL